MAGAVAERLLEVTGLDVVYSLRGGRNVYALSDVSFSVRPAEILGVVGESGCGKSTLGLALLRLLPANGAVRGGSILWRGRDLLASDARAIRRVRGSEICMVFQDPFTTLNPAYTIGTQLTDVQRAHRIGGSGRELRRRSVAVLGDVGIPDADERFDMYPHQFSGGMRQRIAIAIALLLEPALLVADEPTSALDVTLEAQILELLAEMRDRRGTAVMLVSHDLGVIAEVCDRVVVMYAGRIIEEAAVTALFDAPKHPYTRALIAATPSRNARGSALASIPGIVPSLTEPPTGCVFADRCPLVRGVCLTTVPLLREVDGHLVACHAHDPSVGYEQSQEIEPAALAEAST